jgi:acyl carrier protein
MELKGKHMNDNFLEELKALISDITEVPVEKLLPEADFIDELQVDSLKAIEIVAAVEKKYRVVILEQNIPKLRNLVKIAEYIKNLKQG